jgi:hypothetical protein
VDNEEGRYMTEQDNVEPARELPRDISCDRDAQADEPIGGEPGSNQRPKDPWRAFFELADELEDGESPTV